MFPNGSSLASQESTAWAAVSINKRVMLTYCLSAYSAYCDTYAHPDSTHARERLEGMARACNALTRFTEEFLYPHFAPGRIEDVDVVVRGDFLRLYFVEGHFVVADRERESIDADEGYDEITKYLDFDFRIVDCVPGEFMMTLELALPDKAEIIQQEVLNYFSTPTEVLKEKADNAIKWLFGEP